MKDACGVKKVAETTQRLEWDENGRMVVNHSNQTGPPIFRLCGWQAILMTITKLVTSNARMQEEEQEKK